MINSSDMKKRADDILFCRMEEALRTFLKNEAPLYRLHRLGVVDNFSQDEIVIKLHIKQIGAAYSSEWGDDGTIRYIGNN